MAPSSDAQSASERLVVQALDAHRDEYKELAEIWRNLDAKAQGTVAISGIFLAGVFAFAREIPGAAQTWLRFTLSATSVLLAASVMLALAVLWVRSVRSAPLGDAHDTLVGDLLQAPDGTSSVRLQNYYRDQARMWQATNRDVDGVNRWKAALLIAAQVSLALAIVCGAAVTLMRIWA